MQVSISVSSDPGAIIMVAFGLGFLLLLEVLESPLVPRGKSPKWTLTACVNAWLTVSQM